MRANTPDTFDLRHQAADIRRAFGTAFELRVRVENLSVLRGYEDTELCALTRLCTQLAERQAHAERSLHELVLGRCIDTQGYPVSEHPFAAESAAQFRRVG